MALGLSAKLASLPALINGGTQNGWFVMEILFESQIAGWFRMEYPKIKWMMTGGIPIFVKPPNHAKSVSSLVKNGIPSETG